MRYNLTGTITFSTSVKPCLEDARKEIDRTFLDRYIPKSYTLRSRSLTVHAVPFEHDFIIGYAIRQMIGALECEEGIVTSSVNIDIILACSGEKVGRVYMDSDGYLVVSAGSFFDIC